jgi:hypothetical protein
MTRAREPQEQRVAAELEQAAVFPVGNGEQFGEDGAQDVRDLLGSDLPVACQALRHLREAGDVHEDHRAFDRAKREMGLLGQPADHQSRHIRLQQF